MVRTIHVFSSCWCECPTRKVKILPVTAQQWTCFGTSDCSHSRMNGSSVTGASRGDCKLINNLFLLFPQRLKFIWPVWSVISRALLFQTWAYFFPLDFKDFFHMRSWNNRQGYHNYTKGEPWLYVSVFRDEEMRRIKGWSYNNIMMPSDQEILHLPIPPWSSHLPSGWSLREWNDSRKRCNVLFFLAGLAQTSVRSANKLQQTMWWLGPHSYTSWV